MAASAGVIEAGTLSAKCEMEPATKLKHTGGGTRKQLESLGIVTVKDMKELLLLAKS